MKPHLWFASVLIATTPASFAVESSRDDAVSAVPLLTSSFVDLDRPDLAEIRLLAERAIGRIGYTMAGQAASAVEKEGPTKALDHCHLKSLPRTGIVIPDMPRIVGYKRTSLRIRDPQNTPDAAERLALERTRGVLEAGNDAPRLLLQRVEFANGSKEWRAYRPVAVAAQCIACHGPTEAMSVELKAELKKRYPADAATGYSVGEWRGLIRVTISDAPPPEPAPTTALSPAKKT